MLFSARLGKRVLQEVSLGVALLQLESPWRWEGDIERALPDSTNRQCVIWSSPTSGATPKFGALAWFRALPPRGRLQKITSGPGWAFTLRGQVGGEGLLPQMLSHLRGDPEVGEHLAATHLGGGRDTFGGAPFSPSPELGLRKGLSHLRGDPEVGEQVVLSQLALPPTSWRFGIIFFFAHLSPDSQDRIGSSARLGQWMTTSWANQKVSRINFQSFSFILFSVFILHMGCVGVVSGVLSVCARFEKHASVWLTDWLTDWPTEWSSFPWCFRTWIRAFPTAAPSQNTGKFCKNPRKSSQKDWNFFCEQNCTNTAQGRRRLQANLVGMTKKKLAKWYVVRLF